MKSSNQKGAGRQPLTTSRELDVLYKAALPANRSGCLYGAFPYPTKISPEAIALFIAAHTEPGDTVFDGFAGSGTTGLAALLCENPTPELRSQAKKLGLNIKWGARNAVLYEVGALGAFVAQTLTNPPAHNEFRIAAEEILAEAQRDDGWLYAADDPYGDTGTLRYLIWSDLLQCPACDEQIPLWDACVSREPAAIISKFTCPCCDHSVALDDVHRLTEKTQDDVLGKRIERRARKAAWLYGVTDKKTWSRPVTEKDLRLLRRIAKEPVPDSFPLVPIPWGDLYRGGYHQGITHLHHFYTRRNLIVFTKMWERVQHYDVSLRDALRFWLLSYNASHATIMTRAVAKTGQQELVVTSAQPGVLYVSGLPVEKNLIAGLQRKLSTIEKAFATIKGRTGCVQVHQKSSCRINLPDQSIDYVFTDPPFGGNIPYSEINFINEAWLDRYTDRTDEAIISDHQDKGLVEYCELLTAAFSEALRILKPKGKATLIFHSASADVWSALQAAYTSAGFSVECAGVLGKTQGSFKQVTTAGAVRGDPVLLLRKQSRASKKSVVDVCHVADQLVRNALESIDPTEMTPQRLYSRLVTHYLALHQQVPMDANSFYRWHAEEFAMERTADARD